MGSYKGIFSGSKHPNWKGGIKIDKSGYILTKCKDHPYSNSQGYMRQHRLVMEGHIGRYLESYEIVHHINHKVQDNRIENLQITISSDHARHHRQGRIVVDMSSRVCSDCGSSKTKFKTNGRPSWYHSISTKELVCYKCYMREYLRIYRK